LLDPNIEELIEVKDENGQPTGTFEGSLATTQPVKLECTGVDNAMHPVPYDGYYSPSGNNVTWPLGPSLLIQPLHDQVVVPTNAQCQITLKEGIKDKSGVDVPAEQRGPYKFKIARAKPILIDPPDSGDPAKPTEIDAIVLWLDNPYVQFNTDVPPTSFCTDNGLGPLVFGVSPVNMLPFGAFCRGDMPVAFDISPKPDLFGTCFNTGAPCNSAAECDPADPDDTCDMYYVYNYAPFGLSAQEFGFGPNNPVETEKVYTFSFPAGAKIKDKCGVESTFPAPTVEDQTKVTYKTNPFDVRETGAFVPSTGDVVPSNRKVRISFTNVINLASLLPTEYSITPAPTTHTLGSPNGNDIFFRGHFQPDTMYTFTLNAGATIEDFYGKVYTQTEAKTIAFKTQPIAITATTVDKTVFTKATPTTNTRILLTFNQGMVAASLEPADFTVEAVGSSPAPPPLTVSTGATGTTSCSPTSSGCQLRVSGVYMPGDYKFTLKAGAKISDALGNEFTVPTARVINFTVQESDARVVPCLGAP
jgi:hypothetical protein